jgi:hypothetical protein
MHRTRIEIAAAAVAGALAAAAVVSAAEIEVIYSEKPGHPTAVVPGALDANGDPVFTEFKALEVLSMSPDGTQWILKGRNWLGSDLETMLLRGSGTEGAVFAQEGQPVHDGEPGEIYDFFGSSPANFNEMNQFVYTARARGGDSSIKQKGIYFDGADFAIVRAESDPALGLEDLPPNPSGDELFGNSFNSFHLLNSGVIGSHDNTIKNIHSSRRPAIFYDDSASMQTGVTALGDQLWEDFAMNTFWTTPDGATFILEGDDDGDTATDKVLFVGSPSRGAGVVLREGSTIPDSDIIVADIFTTKLIANGDWFARGDDPADNDWAVRNSVLLAATGEPITTGADEHWGNALSAFTGNRNGDWVLVGNTDNGDTATDQVIVLNGVTIVAREGDPIDLDGNGMFDDDAFIGRGNETSSAFHADDIFLTDDGMLYFFASLRNAAGEDLGSFGTGGDSFLRKQVIEAECPADLTGDDVVNVFDLLELLEAWGPCPGCDADLNGDDVVNVFDLLGLLEAWGPCP